MEAMLSYIQQDPKYSTISPFHISDTKNFICQNPLFGQHTLKLNKHCTTSMMLPFYQIS